MSLYNNIRDQLISVVKNALSEYPSTKLIEANTNGTVRNSTYVDSSITFIEQVGMTEQSGRLNEAGLIEYNTPYHLQLRLQVFGSNSGNVAFSLYNRLKNSALNREQSQLYNLSILDKSTLVRSHYKDGEKWVEFFNFSIRLFFISHFTESVNAVESIVVEDVNQSLTFTIPPT